MKKNKAEKLKTFHIGYTIHGCIDVKAMCETSARNIVHCLSNEDIMRDVEFKIDYADELKGGK